ncbi:MAG TPA: class I SAM-dependent methyltransferase [Mycobacteriales bacterium]|nr:class I SAM-dependent methyltransferase [Mycobacteriales bacterium]
MTDAEHWDALYAQTPVDEASWHRSATDRSTRLLGAPHGSVVDVGGGASSLPDALLDAGWSHVAVLDVSAKAIAAARGVVRDTSDRVSFVVADVLTWEPAWQYDAWHDRACLHFLVDDADRERYVEVASTTVVAGGVLLVGTFALDGPTTCSGLRVAHYDGAGLADLFARSFDLEHTEREEHVTPYGVVQPFTWAVLRRRVDPVDLPLDLG